MCYNELKAGVFMYYRFSVDDNIWFLQDLSNNDYDSIFDNSYLKLYKRLHDTYDAKFQLNIYFETDGFDLTLMTDRYKDEWIRNSDWLRLSFHAKADRPDCPYMNASYDEAYNDCKKVHDEIIRFAGKETLDLYTTIHYCQASPDAIRGFRDAGLKGLVGLFEPGRSCYGLAFDSFNEPYKYDEKSNLYYFANDMIINLFPIKEIVPRLEKVKEKKFVEVMIHEQYFYNHFFMYQPDFKEKVEAAVKYLTDSNRKSVFLDDILGAEQ